MDNPRGYKEIIRRAVDPADVKKGIKELYAKQKFGSGWGADVRSLTLKESQRIAAEAVSRAASDTLVTKEKLKEELDAIDGKVEAELKDFEKLARQLNFDANHAKDVIRMEMEEAEKKAQTALLSFREPEPVKIDGATLFENPPTPYWNIDWDNLFTEHPTRHEDRSNFILRAKECYTQDSMDGGRTVAPMCSVSIEYMSPDDFLYQMPAMKGASCPKTVEDPIYGGKRQARGCDCPVDTWFSSGDFENTSARLLAGAELNVGFIDFTRPWEFNLGGSASKPDMPLQHRLTHEETYLHEGRHRACAARALGLKLIPVMVIKPNYRAENVYSEVTGDVEPLQQIHEEYRGQRPLIMALQKAQEPMNAEGMGELMKNLDVAARAQKLREPLTHLPHKPYKDDPSRAPVEVADIGRKKEIERLHEAVQVEQASDLKGWLALHKHGNLFDILKAFGMTGPYVEHERIPDDVFNALPEFYKLDEQRWARGEGYARRRPYAGEVYEYFKYVMNNEAAPPDYKLIQQAGFNVPILDLNLYQRPIEPKGAPLGAGGVMLDGMLQQAKVNVINAKNYAIGEGIMDNARAVLMEAPGADQAIVDWVLAEAAVGRLPMVADVRRKIREAGPPKTEEVNAVIDELMGKARKVGVRHRGASKVADKLARDISHMFHNIKRERLGAYANPKRLPKAMREDFEKIFMNRPDLYFVYIYLKAVRNGDFIMGQAPEALMRGLQVRANEKPLGDIIDNRPELVRLIREGYDLDNLEPNVSPEELRNLHGPLAKQTIHPAPIHDVEKNEVRIPPTIDPYASDRRDWLKMHHDIHFLDIPKMLMEEYGMEAQCDAGKRVSPGVWMQLPVFAKDDLGHIQLLAGDDESRVPEAGLVLAYFRYLIGNRTAAFPMGEQAQANVLGMWDKSAGVNLNNPNDDYLDKKIVMEQVEKWPTKKSAIGVLKDLQLDLNLVKTNDYGEAPDGHWARVEGKKVFITEEEYAALEARDFAKPKTNYAHEMPIYDEDEAKKLVEEGHITKTKIAEPAEQRKAATTGEQYVEIPGHVGVYQKVHRDGTPFNGWDQVMQLHKIIASIWKDPKDPWLGLRMNKFTPQMARNLQLIWGKKYQNKAPNAFDHAAILELGPRVNDRDITPAEVEWLRDRAQRLAQDYRRGELKVP